jgi:hypothetical protein
LPTTKMKQHAKNGTGFSYCVLLRELFDLKTDETQRQHDAKERSGDPSASSPANDSPNRKGHQ